MCVIFACTRPCVICVLPWFVWQIVIAARSDVELMFNKKKTWVDLKSHSAECGRATARAMRLWTMDIDRVTMIRDFYDGVDVCMCDWRC